MTTIPDTIRRAWADPDDREIYDWAAGGNIVLPAAYAIPGPFSVAPSRYLVDPFRAIRSHRVRMVTVEKPVQSGGTLLADISVPWFVANRPGPIMWNMQTVDIANDHALTRAIPVMRGCRALRHLLPSDPRSMNKGGVDFAHMPVWIQGSTPAALQSKSVLFLINDEVWLWVPGRLKWALSRVTAFERVGMSKVLNISQPGQAGDDLDRLWRSSTMRDWQVPCDGCGQHLTPRWSAKLPDGRDAGMVWDRTDQTCPADEWDIDEAVKTVRYRCQLCGHEHHDDPALKARWNKGGQYSGPADLQPHEGYRWNAIPIEPWSGLLREWLEARASWHQGIVGPTVTFLQQRMAEVDDPERTDQDDAVTVGDYDPADKWADEATRQLTIDVQADHFWACARAWARNGASRLLFFGRVNLEDDLVALQERFAIPRQYVGIDVGFQRGDKREVYELCARHRWLGLKGEDRDFYIHRGSRAQKLFSEPQRRDLMLGKGAPRSDRFAFFLLYSSSRVKDIVARLRDGKGAKWEALASKDYARQMHAERKEQQVNRQTGAERWIWVQRRRDNHAWDCECMQVVLALRNPDLLFATG